MSEQTLDAMKVNLIVRITKMDKEEDLRQIKRTVDLIEHHPNEKQLKLLKKLAKPIKEKLDLEELKREQNWKPSSIEEIDELIREIDFQIPLDQLIKELQDI